MSTTKTVFLATLASLLLASLVVMAPQWLAHSAKNQGGPNPMGTAEPGPPWQIDQLDAHRTRVMGFVLGAHGSTLGDLRERWADNLDVAIVAAPGEPGTLEAYMDPVQVAGISGKLVVHVRATAQWIAQARLRSPSHAFMEGVTRRYALSPQDLAEASGHELFSLAFLPQAQLDAQILRERLGTPASLMRDAQQSQHLLYPQFGLDAAIASDGHAVLQYVAPGDFDALLAPLRAKPAAAGQIASPPLAP